MKKILVLLLFLFPLVLSGCVIDSSSDDVSLIDDAKQSLTLEDTLEDDQLPSEIDGFSINWSSNLSNTLDEYQIIQSSVDKEVTLTAVITDGETVRYKTFEVTISLDPDLVTVTNPDDDDDADELNYLPYYSGVETVSDTALKQFLHDLIDDHTKLSYSALWNALAFTDQDPDNSNNVILLYSGRSQSRYENGGAQDEWNREHVWPKSHGGFDTGDIMGTDLHHIRPTDVSVNSRRSNLDFDIGGSLVDETTACFYDGDSFEPRDEVKGDVARMVFYMAVRYEGDISNEIDLELLNSVSTYGGNLGKLSTLLEWHENDPVDAFEQNRNNVIFSYQGNRNPFIDYPEWANIIFQ